MQYFKNGKKIHIKESQKGSFTRYCGGNVTSECIARGKASPDPRIRKKATFADNARKWKHLEGGVLDYEDNNDIFNMPVDPEALNPYSRFTFGLPEDHWYVGNKGESDISQTEHYKKMSVVYNQLQNAISKYYPEYSQSLVDSLADYMTRHYVKENGWQLVNRLVGGYGKARSIDEWVKGMQKTYPKSMKATTFKDYVEGLKSNYQGNKYNSVNPNYFNELLNLFGGDNTRIGRILKRLRIK